MNETMVSNWNSKVTNNDIVYHLGDFAFDKNPAKYFNRLNGQKFLIRGNHDKREVVNLPWAHVYDMKELNIYNQKIILLHYGMRVWNGSSHGSWHLWGHSHNTLSPCGLSFDVGVDCHNFFPISYDEIKIKMEELKIQKEHMKKTPEWKILQKNI
jgi:calcineurin-like phosphoesterase family protein